MNNSKFKSFGVGVGLKFTMVIELRQDRYNHLNTSFQGIFVSLFDQQRPPMDRRSIVKITF